MKSLASSFVHLLYSTLDMLLYVLVEADLIDLAVSIVAPCIRPVEAPSTRAVALAVLNKLNMIDPLYGVA